MNNETVQAYLTFLWTQFQYDWSVFSNPWMLYTVVPDLFYLLFFVVKWFVLLAPVTVPILTLTHGLSQRNNNKSGDQVKKGLTKLFNN